MHNFKYFFREGAGNMLSHGFMSFAAVGVTVACLLIMGTFSLVAYNANINLQDLQKENAVVAFVDESLTDDEQRRSSPGWRRSPAWRTAPSSPGRRPGTNMWPSITRTTCTATWTPLFSATAMSCT